MPGMGGVKFLQRVKEIAPNAVRMVLTGFADERAAVDLINSANVFRFLDKPLPLQVLTEAIEGAVSHYRMTMAERKLAEALALNETIISKAPVGIYLYRADGQCVRINPAAARLNGTTEQALLTQNFRVLPHWKNSGLLDVCLEALAHDQEADFELHTMLGTETSVWAQMRICPLSLDGHQHLLLVASDLSEHKQRETSILRLSDELRELNQRFSFAMDAAEIGVWDFAVPTARLIWDQRMLALYGITEEDFTGDYAAWQKCLHPDDKERCVEEINQALRGEKKFDTAFRVVWPSGDVRHIMAAAIVHRDDDGLPVRMVGVNYDVTQRIQLEAENKLLSSAIRQSSTSIVITDQDGTITFVNQAVIESSGYRQDELIGNNTRVLKSGLTPANLYADLWTTLRSGKAWTGIFCNRKKNGDLYWENAQITPVTDSLGRTTNFIAIKDNITRIKQAEEQLAKAKSEADNANAAKSEFLANMSHEIRTPLNGIIGSAEILKRRVSDEKLRTMVLAISDSGRHLLSIVNDILDISKIESGKFDINNEKFSINKIIHNIFDQFKPQATAKGLHCSLQLTENLPNVVEGDPLRLRQCLLNYLSNALKFTESGSIFLRVTAKATDKIYWLFRFEVVDTGVGIPASTKARLFDSFEQGDSTISKKFGGTGLGLAITRRLARMMGGEAGFESDEGKGSRFWFEVQLGDATDQAPPTPSDPFSDPNAVESHLLENHGSARILLAEDNKINQDIIQGMLADVELQPRVAMNGLQAVEAANFEKFDLILMDIQMPMMNGFEATQIVRNSSLNRTTPIIALTANAYPEDKEKCLSAGMNDFISKPIYPDVFYRTLLTWLQRPSSTPQPATRANTLDEESAGLHQYLGALPWIDIDRGLGFCRKVSRYKQGLRDYADAYGGAMAEARAALIVGDPEKVRRIAHNLKGSSSMLGIVGIQEPAAELEQAVLQNREAGRYIDIIEQRYALITKTIHAMMKAETTK